jgi:glycosyltransferase involved in cell wall biosynthesis
VSGFLVDPYDINDPAPCINDLARCIIELLSSPELARSVGNEARERVEKEFDLETRCLPPLVEAYEEALRQSAARIPHPSTHSTA